MEIPKAFSILFIVFLVAVDGSNGKNFHHKCIHDRKAREHPPKFIPHLGSDSGDGVYKRQAGQYLPFRIAVYYVTENITNSSTVIPMLNDPSGGFQQVINYLQSVLSVIRASSNLYFPSSCAEPNSDGQCIRLEPQSCGDHATVPNEHLETVMVCDPTCREVGGGVDADYILYVTAVNDVDCQDGTLAYASFCFADEVNFRSLAGFTNICPLGLEYRPHAFFMLILHEVLHAIGFSSTDFNFFIDENGNRYSALTTLRINGEDVLAINSPKTLSYGRDYYSCPDLQGVLLENEGGDGSAGSHWEARTLSYEVMNAASTDIESYYTSISNFTLNLLEDSGWYKVNYAVAESLYNYEILWGKELGCNFVTADCDTWPYSCSPPRVDGCSYDYQAASLCSTSDFHDGCYYFSPYSNGFCNSPEVPITNSNSCFPLMYSDGTLDGRCYSHQCYRYLNVQTPFYTVTRFGSIQLCPNDGATLTFSDAILPAILTCPPAELTCSRNVPIISLDPTSAVTQAWCHASCDTCSRPASPAHCLTCSNSLTLRGTAPSVCTTDTCGRGEFLDSSIGSCVACATGCRACTGPNNTDCLACADETLYRVTTNQFSSSVCVTAAECDDTAVSAFGDRTCIFNQSGGASSIHYHQPLLLFLLAVYLLYL